MNNSTGFCEKMKITVNYKTLNTVLNRFADALTSTLSSLHPLSVLNHLHLTCVAQVEAANVLKRDQYLSQLTGGGSKRSTAERTKATDPAVQPLNIYEECIATQIQGTVILPKVG